MSVGPVSGPVRRGDLQRDLDEIFRRLDILDRVTTPPPGLPFALQHFLGGTFAAGVGGYLERFGSPIGNDADTFAAHPTLNTAILVPGGTYLVGWVIRLDQTDATLARQASVVLTDLNDDESNSTTGNGFGANLDYPGSNVTDSANTAASLAGAAMFVAGGRSYVFTYDHSTFRLFFQNNAGSDIDVASGVMWLVKVSDVIAGIAGFPN